MNGPILILGYGVEGQAACRYFLQETEATIYCTDENDSIQTEIEGLSERLCWISAKDAIPFASQCALILRSPGVPPQHPILQAATSCAVPVTTPTGYWLEHLAPKKTITVTGTKGKSTTVSILVHLLKALGTDAEPLGNIGHPPLSETPIRQGHPVVELSSYMMHDIPHTDHLHIVTNLYHEHTDWHGSEVAYRRAKLRPFSTAPSSPGLVPRALFDVARLPSSVRAIEDTVTREGDSLTFGALTITPRALNPLFESEASLIALRTALAAALEHFPVKAVTAIAREAITTYQGLSHRQSIVPSSDDRVWIDDALATVPEATQVALARWGDQNLTLILGGADRGQRFDDLAACIKSYPSVRVLLFGSVRTAALSAFIKAHVSTIVVGSFEEALEKADQMSPPQATILFSPAAASEAPHGNYRVRARLFAEKAASATGPH